jgi:hypothetical protein
MREISIKTRAACAEVNRLVVRGSEEGVARRAMHFRAPASWVRGWRRPRKVRFVVICAWRSQLPWTSAVRRATLTARLLPFTGPPPQPDHSEHCKRCQWQQDGGDVDHESDSAAATHRCCGGFYQPMASRGRSGALSAAEAAAHGRHGMSR